VAARYRNQLSSIHPDLVPTALAVLKLAVPRFAAGEVMDAAEAVPVYLREKVAFKAGGR
jgi:tRNA threonylcarbamoyladenosine biosynthesis protein TsaB